jgi:hypothetical protein
MVARRLAAFAVAGLVLAGAGAARSEHGNPVMVPAPEFGATIPRNAWIRLQSYNGIDYLVEQLASTGSGARAWLVSEKDEVPLKRVRFFDDLDGGYGDGVLVMRPAHLLVAGAKYRLKVSYRWDGSQEEWLSQGVWTVGAEELAAKPMWRGEPRLVAASGDDPPTVRMALTSQPLIEIVAKLTPVEAGQGKPFSLIVVFDSSRWCKEGFTVDYTTAVVRSHCPAEGKLPCAYAYKHRTDKQVGRRFRLELTAIDGAGHAERAPGRPPVVTWPRSQNYGFCAPDWMPKDRGTKKSGSTP